MIMLTIAGIAVGVCPILVGSISEASEDIGLSPFFVGVIVVAIIGSAADIGRDLLRQSQQDGPLGQHLDRLERTDRAVRRAGARPAVVRHRRLPDGARVQRLRARSGSARGHDRHPRRPRRRVEWFEGVQLLAVYVVLAVTFFFVKAKAGAARRSLAPQPGETGSAPAPDAPLGPQVPGGIRAEHAGRGRRRLLIDRGRAPHASQQDRRTPWAGVLQGPRPARSVAKVRRDGPPSSTVCSTVRDSVHPGLDEEGSVTPVSDRRADAHRGDLNGPKSISPRLPAPGAEGHLV